MNTESLWSNFTSKLNELVDKFIPTKKASNRNKLPWVNQQLKNLIRRRDRAFRKYKKTQNPSDRKSFLDLKHLVKKKIKEAYHHYLEEILNVNQ